MRRNRCQPLHDDIQINLTPLIDVVFVVLIMFIIVAPMLELDRVQLAPATQQQAKESSSSLETASIIIHVHADNSIWLNRQPIAEQDLTPCLKQLHAAHANAIPQLFHDKTAPFGTYQAIKNALEAAGYEQLDVILQP